MSSPDPDIRRKRLFYRAWHRGTREADLILGSFAYSDGEFARAMTLIQEWDLTWAADYPLAAGAQIFTDLMNGGLQPVKALLRP